MIFPKGRKLRAPACTTVARRKFIEIDAAEKHEPDPGLDPSGKTLADGLC